MEIKQMEAAVAVLERQSKAEQALANSIQEGFQPDETYLGKMQQWILGNIATDELGMVSQVKKPALLVYQADDGDWVWFIQGENCKELGSSRGFDSEFAARQAGEKAFLKIS